MNKRNGTFTFSFNKRNNDVKDIINEYKEKDINFTVTNYMCECVRFYEKYKNSTFIEKDNTLKNEIINVLKELNFNTLNFNNITLENDIPDLSINKLEIDENINLNNIDETFLEED